MWLKHICVLFRGTPGRMGLWKPRDELPWKHDMFEQMTLLESRNKELFTFIEILSTC